MKTMESGKTRLDLYDNTWYKPGGTVLKRICWYYVNLLVFQSGLFPLNGLKILLLKIFGAKIGRGVVVKPMVNIKYPWRLEIGDHSWIGERVWIDNLVQVSIGSQVCISQGAMLLTGNHDFKKTAFDLMVKEIILEDGVWIGAQALVCPGVICRSHAVLAVRSVAACELEAYTVYTGNPAAAVRKREIN